MRKNLDGENLANFWLIVNFVKFKRCQSFPPYGKLIIYYTINPYTYVHNYLTFTFCSMYTCMYTHTHTHTHTHTCTHTHTYIHTFTGITGFMVPSAIVCKVNLFTIPGGKYMVYLLEYKVLAARLCQTTKLQSVIACCLPS